MARRYRNTTGPAIRRAREGAGMTQDQLAAKLQLAGLPHFDRVTVAKVEGQIRSVFDYELAVIAGVFGVGPSELLPTVIALATELPALLEGEAPGAR